MHGFQGGPPGGDHVLQHGDQSAFLRKWSFQPGTGAMAFGLLSHDQGIQ